MFSLIFEFPIQPVSNASVKDPGNNKDMIRINQKDGTVIAPHSVKGATSIVPHSVKTKESNNNCKEDVTCPGKIYLIILIIHNFVFNKYSDCNSPVYDIIDDESINISKIVSLPVSDSVCKTLIEVSGNDEKISKKNKKDVTCVGKIYFFILNIHNYVCNIYYKLNLI